VSPRHRALAVLAALTFATGLVAVPAAAQVQRLDNPYAGTRVYVNPEWSALAAGEPGGAAVAGQPTGVWLDSIASIGGTSGKRGLRGHLDEALRQGANLVQLVLYDLPGRDCGWLSSNGELAAGELDRYRREFVDPIARILADRAYARLRIVAVVEYNALPFMITSVSPRAFATPTCDTVKAAGTYLNGIGYALARLGAMPNVYNYLDISQHGVLGWAANRQPAAALYAQPRAPPAAGRPTCTASSPTWPTTRCWTSGSSSRTSSTERRSCRRDGWTGTPSSPSCPMWTHSAGSWSPPGSTRAPAC
jgi:cellulose 1,4-beta-cellobiosidase